MKKSDVGKVLIKRAVLNGSRDHYKAAPNC